MEPFTSDRDLKKVLEYLFSIYDANSDGNLTEMEVEKILGGWCKIIVNDFILSHMYSNFFRIA